jgi:hypothetical protein
MAGEQQEPHSTACIFSPFLSQQQQKWSIHVLRKGPATAHLQVAHRCPCADKDECGDLEQLVKELAKQGKMPPFPYEGRKVEPAKMGLDSW